MGLFDYFRRRRERESVVTELELIADPPAASQLEAFNETPAQAQEPPGGDTEAPQGTPAQIDLPRLGELGALIAKAVQTGEVQIHEGETRSHALQGSGLRDELLEIVRSHGIDTDQTLDLGQAGPGNSGSPPGGDAPGT